MNSCWKSDISSNSKEHTKTLNSIRKSLRTHAYAHVHAHAHTCTRTPEPSSISNHPPTFVQHSHVHANRISNFLSSPWILSCTRRNLLLTLSNNKQREMFHVWFVRIILLICIPIERNNKVTKNHTRPQALTRQFVMGRPLYVSSDSSAFREASLPTTCLQS